MSACGFVSGAWPLGVVEVIWALVAWRRYWPREPFDRSEPARGVRPTRG